MNKRNIVIRIILESIIIIGSIIVGILSINEGRIVNGIIWDAIGLIWAIDLGYNINTLTKNEYICFLEFMTYQYMQKIKMEKKEQNAKQEQTNSSKEFKGE